MAARQNYYAESAAESSSTSAYPNATEKVALTFTPDASSSYLIFWTCAMNASIAGNVTRRPQATLKNITAGTTLGDQSDATKDITDYKTRGGIAIETFGASPASQTYELDWGNTSGTADTIKIKDGSIIAIKLGSNDVSCDSGSSDFSTTSTSYVDVTNGSITFTPPSTGDYLIFAAAEAGATSSNNHTYDIRLYHSTASTEYGWSAKTSQVTGGRGFWGTMVKLNLAASSQTFKVQVLSFAGNTAVVRRARIVALRLSDFENNYYDEDRASSTTATSTYVDRSSLTATTSNVEHLVFGVSIFGCSTTTTSPGWRLTEDGTTKRSALEEPTNTAFKYPMWSFYRVTPSAASHTWKTQFNNSATSTSTIYDSAVAVLQLGGGGTTYNQSPSVNAVATVAVTKQVLLSKAVTASGSPAMARTATLARTHSVSAVGTASVLKQIAVLKAVTVTGTASMAKAVTKVVSAAVTATGVAALIKRPGVNRAVTATGTAAMSRLVTAGRTAAVTVTGTAALTKQPQVIKAVTATGTATMVKGVVVMRQFAVTATGVAALVKQVRISKTVTAVGSVAMAKGQAFLRTHSVTAVGVAAMSAAKTYLRSHGTIAIGTASMIRQVRVTKGVTATGSAASSTTQNLVRSHSVTSTGTAALTRRVGINRAVTATGTASMAKGQTLFRTHSVTVVGTATATKQVGVIKTVTAAGTAAMAKTLTLFRSFAVTVVGTASSIQSSGPLNQAFSVTASAVVSVVKTVILRRSVTAVGTASGKVEITLDTLNRITGGDSSSGDPVILVDGDPAVKLAGKHYSKI